MPPDERGLLLGWPGGELERGRDVPVLHARTQGMWTA